MNKSDKNAMQGQLKNTWHLNLKMHWKYSLVSETI